MKKKTRNLVIYRYITEKKALQTYLCSSLNTKYVRITASLSFVPLCLPLIYNHVIGTEPCVREYNSHLTDINCYLIRM